MNWMLYMSSLSITYNKRSVSFDGLRTTAYSTIVIECSASKLI